MTSPTTGILERLLSSVDGSKPAIYRPPLHASLLRDLAAAVELPGLARHQGTVVSGNRLQLLVHALERMDEESARAEVRAPELAHQRPDHLANRGCREVKINARLGRRKWPVLR